MNDEVLIKKWIRPDLVIVQEDRTYVGNYYKMSYAFSEELVIRRDCLQNGTNKYSYEDGTYVACKLVKDEIFVMHSTYGWVFDEEATKKWHDIIAERELLNENSN